MCVWPTCIFVYPLHVWCLPEARRGYLITWNYSYRWLYAAMKMLGIKPGSNSPAPETGSLSEPGAAILARLAD